MASLKEIANGFGSLFYLVNPYESMYKTVKDMPHPNVVEAVSSMFQIHALTQNHDVVCQSLDDDLLSFRRVPTFLCSSCWNNWF